MGITPLNFNIKTTKSVKRNYFILSKLI